MKRAYQTAVYILAATMLVGSCAYCAHGAGVNEPTSRHPVPTAPLTIYPMPELRTGRSLEVLTPEVVWGQGKRPTRSPWRQDKSQSSEWRANTADFAGWPDIAHHAPFGDFFDEALAEMTFTLSNASVGNPSLNRGRWRMLELYVRNGVKPGVTLYVYTSPLYLPEKQEDGRWICRYECVGPNQVRVPTHIGKAVVQYRDEKWTAIAWIAPNTEPEDGRTFMDWRVSVNEFERAAGWDVAPWLPLDVQERIEK